MQHKRYLVVMVIGLMAVVSGVIMLIISTSFIDDTDENAQNQVKKRSKPEVNLQEVLSGICERSDLLKVKYQRDINCGEVFQKSEKQLQDKPTIKSEEVNQDSKYTLLMLDPDAPGHSFEDLQFWLHWAVPNIPGDVIKGGNEITGPFLMDYAGPSPPSGEHRYQFILLESTNHKNVNPPVISKRSHFNLKDFVHKSGLDKVVGVFQYNVKV